MTLNIGDKAPDFDLPADSNKQIKTGDFKGKNIVLYFYPKDDTPGCTTEANDFKNKIAEFEKLNTVILGVSKDSPTKHDKFKAKYDLPFNLISDEEGKMLEDYNVWKEKSMYGKTFMGINRTTYLIDSEGKIAQIWNKVKVKGHVEEVLEAAKNI